jgi:hypothetical protein
MSAAGTIGPSPQDVQSWTANWYVTAIRLVANASAFPLLTFCALLRAVEELKTLGFPAPGSPAACRRAGARPSQATRQPSAQSPPRTLASAEAHPSRRFLASALAAKTLAGTARYRAAIRNRILCCVPPQYGPGPSTLAPRPWLLDPGPSTLGLLAPLLLLNGMVLDGWHRSGADAANAAVSQGAGKRHSVSTPWRLVEAHTTPARQGLWICHYADILLRTRRRPGKAFGFATTRISCYSPVWCPVLDSSRPAASPVETGVTVAAPFSAPGFRPDLR